MGRFMLEHRHDPEECGVVYASFKGHASPLRHVETMASCLSGGHAIWWTVEAPSAAAALEQLPYFVAQRSTVAEIRGVTIP
jgi:hypothetical protein